jgi:predicted membrane protein
MKNFRIAKSKADALSNGFFLITLGALVYWNIWWPGILLALWILFAVRQYLTGRYYELIVSTGIFFTLFITAYFNFNWTILTPLLFVVGGLYLILREFFYSDPQVEMKKNKKD